jgi:hypothetical protein
MNSFTFLFEAMKETYQQRKTKIDVDEFRSGTTKITLLGGCQNLLKRLRPDLDWSKSGLNLV